MAKRNVQDARMRDLLAQECARIIATEGVKDFAKAKRKAVARLGVAGSRALLPSNVEIEQALTSYQRLFQDEHPDRLRALRQLAAAAMRRLRPFRPRLVGPVLHGTAGPHADVELHAFADTPEDLLFFLIDQGVAFASSQRRLKVGNDSYAEFPVVTFDWETITVDVTLFCGRNARDTPYSPVDGRPMKRASLSDVEALLAAG